MSELTLFDRVIAGEIPVDKVYEDEHILAFRDINPQAPVHVLVIPKQKVRRFAELSEQDPLMVGRLFQGAAHVAHELGLTESGYRIVVNNGEHGQQTVEYIHLHILGGRQLNWPPG